MDTVRLWKHYNSMTKFCWIDRYLSIDLYVLISINPLSYLSICLKCRHTIVVFSQSHCKSIIILSLWRFEIIIRRILLIKMLLMIMMLFFLSILFCFSCRINWLRHFWKKTAMHACLGKNAYSAGRLRSHAACVNGQS